MSNAFAYHRIITNDEGLPIDYEFIQVNPAFEKLTGWKANDIVGRTICDIIPGFYCADFDWIKLYGQVALQGETKDFEHYSENLHKWYRVSAYSPQPGFFATIFSDVTASKQVEQDLRESEIRWKYALEGAGDGLWDWTYQMGRYFSPRSGRLCWVLPRMKSLTIWTNGSASSSRRPATSTA